MKPEQVRERMELFGLGTGKKESDLFLKDVCDAYEDLYYKLMEKEDKINTLNDAVKYYKNMEGNITQMLSTISEISEKTEHAAEKTAQLTVKEAESKADTILADASQKAAQILENAKEEAQEIRNDAEIKAADTKKELNNIKQEFEAYALRFYDFIESQKLYFEEHKIDVQSIRENLKDSQEKAILSLEKETISHTGLSINQAMAAGMPAIQPIPVQTVSASSEEQAAISSGKGAESVTVNQIRKIPNTAVQKSPSMEEIEAKIPEHIRNIPISDHTETLDEIIQSIKKSYEEVENK